MRRRATYYVGVQVLVDRDGGRWLLGSLLLVVVIVWSRGVNNILEGLGLGRLDISLVAWHVRVVGWKSVFDVRPLDFEDGCSRGGCLLLGANANMSPPWVCARWGGVEVLD